MDTSIPTYYPGDTIRLRLRLEHEVNLIDVWASFEKEVGAAPLRQIVFPFKLRNADNLRLLDRAGPQMISEVVLEALVVKGQTLPGTYKLFDVHGLPFGEGARRQNSALSFDVPNGVRFNVADLPTGERPKVTHWQFGWETQARDPVEGA